MHVSIFKFFRSNQFLKNVTTLALGTIIAQLVLVASTPLLTRLYSAEDFGLLALFTSISTIAAILTTGRYEYAIGLPKENKDAKNVFALTIVLGMAISFVYLVLLFFLRYINGGFFYLKLIHSPIMFFVPLSTFASATFSAFQYWFQRGKKYKQISFSNTLQVVIATLFNVFFGLIGFKLGLIFSLIIGQVFLVFVLSYFFFKESELKGISFYEIKRKAKEFVSFPKYMIVSDLATTASQQMIPIVFSALFSSSMVGLYALANRMLRIPTIVLTSSIGNVFRNDAIDSVRLIGNCKQLYIATAKKLIIICIPIYGFLAILAPWLFSVFFGSEWVESGIFARIICIMIIFDFVAVPLNTLFYVFERQKIYMRLQIANGVFGILVIYGGYLFYNNAYVSVLFFAINGALFSLFSLVLTYRLSNGNLSKEVKN